MASSDDRGFVSRILRKVMRAGACSLPVSAHRWQSLALDRLEFGPETVIQGVLNGYFPEASDSGRIEWHSPDLRGVLPIEGVHVSGNLRRLIQQDRFEVRVDTCFREVVERCSRRERTWISDRIVEVYSELHSRGLAHSVEVWREDRLVGGLYGITLGSYFQGESQFHEEANAGKIALVAVSGILKARGFLLHDVQYLSEHLAGFGCREMPRQAFRSRLVEAALRPASWPEPGPVGAGSRFAEECTLPSSETAESIGTAVVSESPDRLPGPVVFGVVSANPVPVGKEA